MPVILRPIPSLSMQRHRRMLQSSHITKHVLDKSDAYLITDCKLSRGLADPVIWDKRSSLTNRRCCFCSCMTLSKVCFRMAVPIWGACFVGLGHFEVQRAAKANPYKDANLCVGGLEIENYLNLQ